MKESIGNAFVMGLFVTFTFLTLLILTFAINYSRASKVKNRLVNYVQTYAENSLSNSASSFDFLYNDDFKRDVELVLSKVGYRRKTNLNYYEQNCHDYDNTNGVITMDTTSTNFDYCIYAFPTSRGYFYRVVTYMYFDIPVIGTTLKFPISGETKTIYDLGDR